MCLHYYLQLPYNPRCACIGTELHTLDCMVIVDNNVDTYPLEYGSIDTNAADCPVCVRFPAGEKVE